MKCPKCGSNNLQVTDTVSDIDDEVYRCRKCLDCDNKFYTVEFEVECNDEIINIFKRAHRARKAKSNQKNGARKHYGPVVIFRKNEF